MGALCILDFRAKARRANDVERERLYRLYVDHHDRITTWDMVDRAAPSVVGGWPLGRDPAPLHELAGDLDPLRRRTAITAPLWFVRYGRPDDFAALFPLAAALVDDPEPVVSSAVGIALKHAGGRDGGPSWRSWPSMDPCCHVRSCVRRLTNLTRPSAPASSTVGDPAPHRASAGNRCRTSYSSLDKRR